MTPTETPRQGAKRQDAMDRAAACCKDAIEHATSAQFATAEPSVRESARVAVHAAAEAMNLLVSVGAKSLIGDNRQPLKRLDLSALAILADPAAPELLALLEQAQSVAEGIDFRRGRVVDADIPLSPGESRGTDLAESISNLAQRVRVETHGPAGRD